MNRGALRLSVCLRGRFIQIELLRLQVNLPNGRRLFHLPELTLADGEHCLIEGASGTGKTTLLHLIAGLLAPKQGSIRVGDFDFKSRTETELCRFRRENIGLVFQRLNLVEHLSLAENVSLSLPAMAESNGKIESALKRVGLFERRRDLCSYLSQGEQQRVAVARVLAAAPPVILADEPTSSLDEKNALFVTEALREAARGKTLVIVSHDQRIRSLFRKVLQFEDLIA